MNYTTLSNFINNAENIISNTITNEEHTLIKTEEGNAVLLPEAQYNCLLETLARKRKEWITEKRVALIVTLYRYEHFLQFSNHATPII